MRRIHWWPVDSHEKGPVKRKCFHLITPLYINMFSNTPFSVGNFTIKSTDATKIILCTHWFIFYIHWPVFIRIAWVIGERTESGQGLGTKAISCTLSHVFISPITETCYVCKQANKHKQCVTLRVAHTPGMPGTFSPPPRVSDPDMHNGTCVTHVPWCMRDR